MPATVQLLVFTRAGQRTVAASPAVMDRIAAYARDARACGLSDEELRDDIARFWPSARRAVEVRTGADGAVWVSMTPAWTVSPRPPLKRRRSRHVAEGAAF